jgi:hypothetical protein
VIVETGLPLYASREAKNKNDVIVYGFPVTGSLLQTHIFPVKWVG